MDVHATLLTPATPDRLFAAIEALDGYPDWLDIVSRVEPIEAAPGDPGPAWLIDLRAQLGPLRRSKRLRMVRRVHNPPHRVQFTRRELDGKSHSPWTLTADVSPGDGSHHEASSLAMVLHYGGSLWVPMLDRRLRDEIERSKPRLLEVLADG